MKKIFYLFLLMLNLTIFGQNYPTIHPLTGGFTFIGEKLDNNPQVFSVSTPTGNGCSVNFSDNYKFYSFKANFDMVFAFDLVATKPDFRFVVWKLAAGRLPKAIFENGGTITANRSVQGSTNIKGLREGLSNICESNFTSSASGYAKAFEGGEILNSGETIVIVVYGSSSTDLFDIKINVAEERPITKFNTNCFNVPYNYQEIYDEIKTNSGLDNITIYTDNTFNTVVNAGTTFPNATTLYAQVKDASGDTKYIYTIPLSFIPQHEFNFNSNINQVAECSNQYTLRENSLLNLLFSSGTNLSNYSIKTVNGNPFVDNSTINLVNGSITDLKIVVSYNGTCPVDSGEKIIQIKQGTPVLENNISDPTCDSNYIIDFDRIFQKLGEDKNVYDLIVTLNGANIGNGTTTPITSTLNYKVKIKSKTAGCESNEVDFVVTKTSEANIINTEIKDFCINDPAFTPTQVGFAVSRIQNGNSYTLRYYKEDGSEITMDQIFEYMKEKLVGKVIVKAFAVDNSNTICDTERELKFTIYKSSFQPVTNIAALVSSCVEPGAGYTFTKNEIETYLKTKLGRNDLTFQGISDETLTDNQTKVITFKVQINGESCWSEMMFLELKVVAKPNFSNITLATKYCEGEQLTIDKNVLISLLGSTISNYEVLIDGTLITNNSITKTLNFSQQNPFEIQIEIRNNGCSQFVKLFVTKKTDLVIPPNLSEIISKQIIAFCATDINSAKSKVDELKQYIKSNFDLETTESTDDIVNKFTSNNGNVMVNFKRFSECGSIDLLIPYQKYQVPAFEINSPEPVCTGEKYILDFEQLANDKGLDVTNYSYQVVGNGALKLSSYKYELGIGKYSIVVKENEVDGCSLDTEIIVSEVERPTIEKISVTPSSIIVIAKGKPTLEYALFDVNDNLLVNYQTSNELKIPANITDFNFKVRVRSNNCAISDAYSVTFLSLPNAVTPNGDGKNDLWKPMGSGDTTNSYQLIIFDRYGKQIYFREGVNIIEWDGTSNGKPVNNDTYWYMLKPINESNILQVQYSGSILVKRKTK